MKSVERVIAHRRKMAVKKIAKQVMHGKLKSGRDEDLINKAGYDYDEVNDRVNIMLRGHMDQTISEIAQEVMEGIWGEGEICKQLLNEAGYDYNDVMKEIKRLKKQGW